MRGARTDQINALAELERLGWKFEPTGSDEVKLKCPAHADDTPSASLNVKKNLWKCHACKKTGDIVSMLALITGGSRSAVIVDLSTRYDLEDVKVIDSDSVERMHAKVWDAGPLLQALRQRGITDDMIRSARIGFHDGRITIPVYDETGRCRNVRRYLPGAQADRKMRNARGFGKARLYREADVEKHDRVWICGGELKALVVGELLEGHDVGACAATAGEGFWDHSWTSRFRGKHVWVCMDVDEVGRHATQKVGESIMHAADTVHVINLPLDKEKYPKGDVNDYVGLESAGAAELLALMESAELLEPRDATGELPEKGVRSVDLRTASNPVNVGWRVEFPAVVQAIDTVPYIVPCDVDVQCTRDQPLCHLCPVKMTELDDRGLVRLTIPATSPYLLDMVGAPKKWQREAVREGLGIPVCKAAEFTVATHHQVHDTRLSPQLEIDSQGGEVINQGAMIVNSDPTLNAPYLMGGRVFAHPKTQQATLILDSLEETEDSLSAFNPTDDELHALRVFRPEKWTSEAIEAKLEVLYADLASNVTGIYGRQDMHTAIDLAYHSPLFIPFERKKLNGWVNVLIMGDSAQGKSETREMLTQHYGLGEKVECKNATVAGLMGGLQQMGNRWYHSWGVIPTHDKRLVHLEEVKGADVEVIGKLTDMRSSGIAEIPKIERARTHARTRLVWYSNQRAARPISSYSFGVEAIHELMGALEDVRRLDLAIILAAGEVDIDEARPKERPPHEHTGGLCKRLILWAWTIEPENIVIEDDALTEVKTVSKTLCAKYTESLPLVDRGTMRHKLARLSAALAVRTFSCKNRKLVVRLCHVRVVHSLLDRSYSGVAFGYDDYSRAQRALHQIPDPISLRKFVCTIRHAEDFVQGMLYTDEVTLADIQDLCGADRDTAQANLSRLVRGHALTRHGRNGYVKTPAFIDLLKQLKTGEDLTRYDDEEEV